MAGRGRPKKPTAVLKMHGTFRKERHAGQVEHAKGAPLKPKNLDATGSLLWDGIVEQIKTWGAAECDSAALASMCEWWSIYRRCMDKLDDPEAEGAYRLQMMAGHAWNNFYRMAAQFGITPADRAKMKTPAAAGDDLDKFLDETA